MIIINPVWIIFVQQFGFTLIVSLAFLLPPVEKDGMADLAAPKL